MRWTTRCAHCALLAGTVAIAGPMPTSSTADAVEQPEQSSGMRHGSRLGAPSAVTAAPASETRSLMPVPQHVAFHEGRLRIDSTLSVAVARFADERLRGAIRRAIIRLESRVAQPLARNIGTDTTAATLIVNVAGAGQRVQSVDEDERYTLDVSDRRVLLRAATVVGAMHGLETILQLVEGGPDGFYFPSVTIDDAPRFPWRGLLVDVGRHFMPVEAIKRTLDGMAVVKLNVLHWHLSEDQGFRVESKLHPRLQLRGSDGNFYTQQQIRDVVAYARERGIRVVPEFDMPGHSTAWFVGYPQYASGPGPFAIERRFGVFDPVFDPTREEVYGFLDSFVGEMAPLFPDAYWHIGGDEVNGVQWKANRRIQAFMRRRRIADLEALQAYFNRRLSRILTSHGKRLVGWDEILHPDLPKSAIIQSWRGTSNLERAAQQGFTSILSAPYYLDQIQTAEQHYLADPLPPTNNLTDAQKRLVLGGEACMWAEHITAETIDSRIWPRLAAVAERLWSPWTVRDVDDMYRRLASVSIDLESVGLGHESHTARMLRRIVGAPPSAGLLALFAAVQPANFGQRARALAPTQRSPLVRPIDAARPDPWLRQETKRLAAAVIAGDSMRAPAVAALSALFARWRDTPAEVLRAASSAPLLAEAAPAAEALSRTAAIGEEALRYVTGSERPPAGWADGTLAELTRLEDARGTLRVAVVPGVRLLVERAGRPGF